MSYASKDIRNIALLGHGGNGKTSLAESILFLTGVTDRLGSTAAGNSVSDYDPEEIRRQISRVGGFIRQNQDLAGSRHHIDIHCSV